ncbi:PhzF family phenazine biosynthesis protein [Sulfidibacter corallicola]|uniref:PhzF family phenazine biosynthesis protein n=1 Tax=Sulfidibacter corallicola TaxID=2818388 RepID=A0A8A4THP8_SULCO|nr:PhzF family phenazine biosynthesis protein [Sulfidibacter corallicola]QTD48692.1 PhzF family phenazine biosynthesis protein [Sulfidibacter corallicola]
MQLKLFQVDAFTSELFGGNPAAVVPLTQWLPDELMVRIAMENNLSETVFFVPEAHASAGDFRFRWFTPSAEVDLCGHASLAAAHVLWRHLDFPGQEIRIQSMSGPLSVTREGDGISLDFPARPGEPVALDPRWGAAMGAMPVAAISDRKLMLVYESREQVAALTPDMAALSEFDHLGVIATAPAEEAGFDFVSRFFAPKIGIPEDPATGAAHCTLIPYWAERLGTQTLAARQISPRGAVLRCVNRGDRVTITGQAVTYLEGKIYL